MKSRVPGTLESHGLEVVGYHDLDGHPGFKLALTEQNGRWFLYTGLLWDRGWAVLEVTDPTEPQLRKIVEGPPGTWTIQVQAAEGLLVAGLEKPVAGWGVAQDEPYAEGAWLFDIRTDPSEPQLLGTWNTGATGTHRNYYAGGQHAYMAATRPGYLGHGLAIVDLSDPSQPKDVSFWAWPDQLDDHAQGVAQAYLHGPAYVRGDRAYLSYGRIGMVILDVSDVTAPRLVSRLDLGSLGNWLGCHSAIPVSGRDLLVVNSETIEEGSGDPWNYTFLVDISDETAPQVMSSFPQPTPRSGLSHASYFDKGGRFGPHNQHQYQGNPAHLELQEHVVMTWFNAGLRIYDISDPRQPQEVGFFVPEDPATRHGVLPSSLVTQFEDVVIDARGFIYCTDKNHGIFVLRFPDGLR